MTPTASVPPPKPVVTIYGTYGTGAKQVGRAVARELGLDETADATTDWPAAQWWKSFGDAQLDALIERLGDNKVGLGSDFDGATMPEGVRDVCLLPNLIEAMRARGYEDATIRKIAYGNWLRVMEQTWGA